MLCREICKAHSPEAKASMTAVNDTVATKIADYMEEYGWATLPAHIQNESVRALLNYLGCTIGGAVTTSMSAATKGVQLLDNDREVPIAGRSESCGLSNAALLGALSASTQTFDDTHLATITHPTAPVASACLAMAHRLSKIGTPVTGERLLAAIAIGIELQCRISNAIRAGGTAHMGWYITGLSGGIGTAIAVGHLLHLSHSQMVWAIGLAATQACGLRATHGSMAIAYVPGLAARSGLDAAVMAKGGFECSAISIDGRNGLLQVLSSTADADLITRDLGSHYELMNNAYKPYPCGIVIHPAIDGCLEIVRKYAVDVAAIECVELDIHPDALTLTWRKLPDHELDAQVSLFHWVAASLVFGAAGLEQGRIDAIQNPVVRALQKMTEATVDSNLKDNQARVRVKLKSGKILESVVTNAIGSASNPMTAAALIKKFESLALPVLGQQQSSHALTLCLSMKDQSDAAVLLQSTALPK